MTPTGRRPWDSPYVAKKQFGPIPELNPRELVWARMPHADQADYAIRSGGRGFPVKRHNHE
jgi:hypothetical protein